jgi:hypothetical protein
MQIELFWCALCGSVRGDKQGPPWPKCCGVEMLWMSSAVDKTNRFGEPIGRRVQFTVDDRERQPQISKLIAGDKE